MGIQILIRIRFVTVTQLMGPNQLQQSYQLLIRKSESFELLLNDILEHEN